MIKEDLLFPIINVSMLLMTGLLFWVVLGSDFVGELLVMFGIAICIELVLFGYVIRRDRKADLEFKH